MFNKDRPVYKLSLKKELKNKKDEIIEDILKNKQGADGTPHYNFQVFTKYNDYLYDLFIKKSKKPFKNLNKWMEVPKHGGDSNFAPSKEIVQSMVKLLYLMGTDNIEKEDFNKANHYFQLIIKIEPDHKETMQQIESLNKD